MISPSPIGCRMYVVSLLVYTLITVVPLTWYKVVNNQICRQTITMVAYSVPLEFEYFSHIYSFIYFIHSLLVKTIVFLVTVFTQLQRYSTTHSWDGCNNGMVFIVCSGHLCVCWVFRSQHLLSSLYSMLWVWWRATHGLDVCLPPLIPTILY